MNGKQESINWDNEKSELIITKQERIRVDGATSIDDAIKKIDAKLAQIVKTVKGLKLEAEALKNLKYRLRNGGVIDVTTDSDPVPVAEEE